MFSILRNIFNVRTVPSSIDRFRFDVSLRRIQRFILFPNSVKTLVVRNTSETNGEHRKFGIGNVRI